MKKTHNMEEGFTIKRDYNKILSNQESLISESIKKFKKIGYKMKPGDVIEVTEREKEQIMNYLRRRKLQTKFTTRILNKEKNIYVIFCKEKIEKINLI